MAFELPQVPIGHSQNCTCEVCFPWVIDAEGCALEILMPIVRQVHGPNVAFWLATLVNERLPHPLPEQRLIVLINEEISPEAPAPYKKPQRTPGKGTVKLGVQP